MLQGLGEQKRTKYKINRQEGDTVLECKSYCTVLVLYSSLCTPPLYYGTVEREPTVQYSYCTPTRTVPPIPVLVRVPYEYSYHSHRHFSVYLYVSDLSN